MSKKLYIYDMSHVFDIFHSILFLLSLMTRSDLRVIDHFDIDDHTPADAPVHDNILDAPVLGSPTNNTLTLCYQ